MNKTSEDSPDGIPHGVVGSDCIKKGYDMRWRQSGQQPSRRTSFCPTRILFFVAGVNHNSLNNSSCIALDINNAAETAKVASALQTNPDATGFDSGVLTGSAQAVLQELALRYGVALISGGSSEFIHPSGFEDLQHSHSLLREFEW